MLIWALMFAFVAVSSGGFGNLPVQNCGRTQIIRNVKADRCSSFEKINGMLSCVVKKSRPFTLMADFIPPFNSRRATATVIARRNGSPLPFFPPSGLKINVCSSGINPPCPLRKGRTYRMRYNIPFLGLLLPGNYDMEVTFKDGRGKLMGCVRGQGKLTL